MTAEQAVAELCMAVVPISPYQLIMNGVDENQLKCLIESILILSKSAGIPKEKVIQSFGIHASYVAEEIWDERIS